MSGVLLINGSPNKNGCVGAALEEVKKTLNAEGIETEEIEKSGMPAQETDIFTSFPDGL